MAPLIALIIIGREITISALREWMAKAGKSASVAVSFVGKLKTTAQMIAIVLLLYFNPFAGLPIASIGTLLIWVAALLTLVSMVYYLAMAARALAKSFVRLLTAKNEIAIMRSLQRGNSSVGRAQPCQG